MWTSERLKRCPLEVHLAFPFLLPLADHHGRFDYDVRALWIKSLAYRGDVPLSKLQEWLDCMEQELLFARYEAGGKQYAAWLNFRGIPASKRYPSRLPPPPFDNSKPNLPKNFLPPKPRTATASATGTGTGTGTGAGSHNSSDTYDSEGTTDSESSAPSAPTGPDPGRGSADTLTPEADPTNGARTKQRRDAEANEKKTKGELLLEKFTAAFNAAYTFEEVVRNVGPPSLNPPAQKQLRALVATYGEAGACCFPFLAWRYDVQRGGDRLKTRVPSQLLRDGTKSFEWSSLLQRADQIPQDGHLRRIWELAKGLGLESGLERLRVPTLLSALPAVPVVVRKFRPSMDVIEELRQRVDDD